MTAAPAALQLYKPGQQYDAVNILHIFAPFHSESMDRGPSAGRYSCGAFRNSAHLPPNNPGHRNVTDHMQRVHMIECTTKLFMPFEKTLDLAELVSRATRRGTSRATPLTMLRFTLFVACHRQLTACRRHLDRSETLAHAQ